MKVKVFVFQPFTPSEAEKIIDKWIEETIPNTLPKDINIDQNLHFGLSALNQPVMHAMITLWYEPERIAS